MLEMITNVARLDYLIDLCQTITTEVIFESKQTIFETRILDPSNSVMLKLEVDIISFDSYKTKGFKFYINTTKIKQLTRILKPDDKIKLEYIKDFNQIKVSSGRLYRKINLIDLSTCIIPDKVPEPKHNIKILVNTNELRKGIKISELESEAFSFYKKDNRLYVKSLNENSGIELSDFKYSENSGNFKYFYTTNWIKSIINFAPDYLNIRTHSNTKDVQIFPIILDFLLRDNIGKVNFILAPRIIQE